MAKLTLIRNPETKNVRKNREDKRKRGEPGRKGQETRWPWTRGQRQGRTTPDQL